jgi:hypothetical protein
MILHNSHLENHPAGVGDLNAIINGNWTALQHWISPTIGLTASQTGTTVTASGAVFAADDVGATITFADGTVRTITAVTSATVVEVSVSGSVTGQAFYLWRTDQTAVDALIRGLTKRVRMLSSDDGKLLTWDDASKRVVLGSTPQSGGTVDETVSSSDTYEVTQQASQYAFRADSGTTDANITSTFNITALPTEFARHLIVHARVIKGATAGSRTHSLVVQINGVSVGLAVATDTGTSADTKDSVQMFTWNPWASKWTFTELTIGP